MVQGSKVVCVDVITERRRRTEGAGTRTGKLGSFCMVPQLLAGLKMTWLVIGRSVDRATRLSRPRAVRPAAPGAQFDHCHAHFTRSPAIAPTTSTACPVLPSQTAALESRKSPIRRPNPKILHESHEPWSNPRNFLRKRNFLNNRKNRRCFYKNLPWLVFENVLTVSDLGNCRRLSGSCRRRRRNWRQMESWRPC